MIDVQVEDSGPCKKLLKIRVPQEDIKVKLEESYDKLRDSADLDGFRKGHVPRKLLENRFGEQVIEDLKQSLMADASSEALKKTELKALGEPSFDSAEFKPDEDFTFGVTVEVEPQFEAADYKGLKVKKLAEEVTDEQVETGIRALLRNIASVEVVRDGTVQPGDIVGCDWEVKVGDEIALSGKGDRFEVQEGIFAELGVVDVPGKLAGARKDETRELDAAFPEDYPLEKHRGKPGKLRVTINALARAAVPELNIETAKKLDFDSVEEVRKHVREYLATRVKQSVREDLERQVEEALLAKAQFDLPVSLLKRQAQRNFDRQQMKLKMRGLPETEITKRLGEIRAASEQAAERGFRLYFILMKIADKEKLFVTEGEVENAVARLAAAYEKSVHKMSQELDQQDMQGELRTQMRMDKTMAFLIENAVIEG